MSGWDAWTDTLVSQGAFFCGIHGRDGNPWSAKNMTIAPTDAKKLEEVICSQNTKIYTEGITINDERWLPLRLEDHLLVMKGKGENKDKTMTVCLTKTAMVFGCNKDGCVQGGQVRKAVEDLKGNLETAGY